MSRLSVPALDSATGATAEVYAQIKKAAGRVPNAFAAVGAYDPAALRAILATDAVLAASALGRQDREIVKLVVSQVAGCDYCVAAHSTLAKMAGVAPEVLTRIRTGESTGDAKRDALVHFVWMLAETSGTISDDEFSAIKAAGYSDEQLVDISLAIAIVTFTNVFNRINDTTVDFPAAA